MTDTSVEFHAVGKTGDIAEDECMRVSVGRREIAISNLAGEFYATDDICSHAYASMSDGYIEGDQIECPLHGACFEIKTGKAMTPPANRDLDIFPVKLDGDTIMVGVAPEADG